jgi:aminoglycoside phosphotransferase (APT) family kinase protein
MAQGEAAAAVIAYLKRRGRFDGELDARFLAAGEYNENYLIDAGGRRWVFRINHGSQLGLDRQIEYEHRVLEAVAPSEVTPRPDFVDADAEGLGRGVLMMEYLPGRPLDYRRDLSGAAEVFARVHALPPADGLVVQDRPVADIAAECGRLYTRQPDHPRTDLRRLLEDYHRRVMDLYDRTRSWFEAEANVMVNTEVNSGNFLVDGGQVRLVDWEKAVVSKRYQDLGHFLVSTTTRWKTDLELAPDQERRFLKAYRAALSRAGVETIPDLDELTEKTEVLKKTILLRALSWCYMAWYEYTHSDRPIRNPDTFDKIRTYLDEASCILR